MRKMLNNPLYRKTNKGVKNMSGPAMRAT